MPELTPQPDTTLEPLTRADHQREAYTIASNAVRMAYRALDGVVEGDWTGERKDGVLFYLEDLAATLGRRANGCGRF